MDYTTFCTRIVCGFYLYGKLNVCLILYGNTLEDLFVGLDNIVLLYFLLVLLVNFELDENDP